MTRFCLQGGMLLLSMLISFGMEAQSWQGGDYFIVNNVENVDGTAERAIQFYQYPWRGRVLELDEFRLRHMSVKKDIPLRLPVRLPDLSGYDDTSWSAAFLPYESSILNDDQPAGEVVVLIIAQAGKKSPAIFLDRNLDRDYTNDGFPLRATDKAQAITFQRQDRDPLVVKLQPAAIRVEPPHQLYPTSYIPDQTEQVVREARLSRGNTYLDLAAQVFIAPGILRYQYQNAFDLPSKYLVSLNSKGARLLLNFRLNRWRLGVNGTYENLYYWTSELEVQTQPLDPACDGSPECRSLAFDLYKNQDRLPRNRLSYGANLGYNFQLSRLLYLVPYVQASYFQYLGQTEYFPDRFEEEGYLMGQRWLFEGGLRLEQDVAGTGALVATGGFRWVPFQPRGFFDRPEISQGQATHFVVLLGLGYQWRL